MVELKNIISHTARNVAAILRAVRDIMLFETLSTT